MLAVLGVKRIVALAGRNAGMRAMRITREENFDLVFTDREMPEHDGFAVAHAVRPAFLQLHTRLRYLSL
jgi:YesN/AraC family two-component response regulator